MAKQLPYGYRGLRESANVDALISIPSGNTIYFKFGISDWKRTRKIIMLPKNSMIAQEIFIRIEESFSAQASAVEARLKIGTIDDNDSIANVNAAVRGVVRPWFASTIPASSLFLRILKKDTDIYCTITGSGTPTKGYGWGILTYLNMPGIQGYRNVERF